MSDDQSLPIAAAQDTQTAAASAAAPPAAKVKKPRKPSEWNKFIAAEKKGTKGRADFKQLSQKYKEIRTATPSA